MAYWLKDSELSLLWCRFDPWPKKFYMPWAQSKKKLDKFVLPCDLSSQNPPQCWFSVSSFPITYPTSNIHIYTQTHQFNQWGRSRDVRVCPQCRGWSVLFPLCPLADVIHVNTLAAEVDWISWTQDDGSKINKMKQHNLEFVVSCETEQMRLCRWFGH